MRLRRRVGRPPPRRGHWGSPVSFPTRRIHTVGCTDLPVFHRPVRRIPELSYIYGDWQQFLDGNEYDTAVVSTPNHTHVDIVLPLMEQGLDVFCEKPLATTLEDHDRIIEADRETDALFHIGFNARHSPVRQRFEAAIESGEIGELGMLSCHEVRHPFPLGHYYTGRQNG